MHSKRPQTYDARHRPASTFTRATLAGWFLVLVLSASSAYGLEPVILTELQDEYLLGFHLEYLMDASAEYTIDQVSSSGFDSQFEPGTSKMPHFGRGKVRSVWVRFRLRNDRQFDDDWVVELTWLVQKFEVYERDTEGNWQGRVTGDTYPFTRREISYGFPVFRLKVAPGSESTFYARITEQNLAAPMRLWASDAFDRHNLNKQMWNGLTLGLMGVMALYNLFLFFSLRDESYLYYVLYVIVAAMADAIHGGVAQAYLWPETGIAYREAADWVFPLASICYFRFAQTFLLSGQHTPRLHRVLWAVVVLSLVNWVGMNFFGVPIKILPGNFQGIFNQLVVIATAVVVLRNGYRPAVYFLVSFFASFILMIATGLSFDGVLPFDFFWSFNGPRVGMMIQVVLLSFGLADRINILRRERAEQETAAKEAERRRIETQEQSERKSAFLASMSHELRTPMNAIKGFTSLVLRREKSLSDRNRENLEKVTQASDHLLAMINDLLDLSKIEAGRMDVNAVTFDVRHLVNYCVSTVSPLVQDGVELRAEVDEDMGEAHTDEARLRQMLINLASNAIKFTESGSITVKAEQIDGQLALSVSDTGKGIPAEELPTLFDEYRQVKGASESVVQKGTGLGLSITRKFAELLGGTIGVESEEGKGSTFTVRIPAQYTGEASA